MLFLLVIQIVIFCDFMCTVQAGLFQNLTDKYMIKNSL